MLTLLATLLSAGSGGQDDMLETYIAQIADGHKDGMALLYEQTHAAVYGFALSILRNRQDAEDVQHDTYIQIWKAAGSYQPSGKPIAWIYTITRNLTRMRLRDQGRTVTVSPEDWHTMFADIPAVDQEDRMVLASLLEVLSDEERQIILLHAMTGLKHREIAELMELKLATVLSKYNRAIKKLRHAWKENF